MRNWPILLLLCFPSAAAEKAAYDSNGRIIAMLSSAEDVEVTSSIVAVLPDSGERYISAPFFAPRADQTAAG